MDIPDTAGSEDSTIDIINRSTPHSPSSPSSPGKPNKSSPSSQGDTVTVVTPGSGGERSIEEKGQGSVAYQQEQQAILEDEFGMLTRNMQNVSLEQVR